MSHPCSNSICIITNSLVSIVMYTGINSNNSPTLWGQETVWRSSIAAGCCRITSAITIVYITPNVHAWKQHSVHGLITKIPDKCACPLSTNYNVDTNSIWNSGKQVIATLTISFLQCYKSLGNTVHGSCKAKCPYCNNYILLGAFQLLLVCFLV